MASEGAELPRLQQTVLMQGNFPPSWRMFFRSFRNHGWSLAIISILLLSWILAAGCARALLESNTPSQVKLRLLSPNAEKYTIIVTDGQPYPVPVDGRVTIEIPRLPSGCATYFLGVKVGKGASSDNVAAICLNRESRTVRKFSLNDIGKLSADTDGYRILKAE